MKNQPIELQKEAIKEAAGIFKLLSDPTRVSILYLLEEKEMNVGSITKALEMEQSAISHQLQLLRSARLVKARREGRSVYYSQDDEHVYQLMNQLFNHILEKETYTNFGQGGQP